MLVSGARTGCLDAARNRIPGFATHGRVAVDRDLRVRSHVR